MSAGADVEAIVKSVPSPLPSGSGTKAWANRPRLKVNSPVMAKNIFFLSGWIVMNPYLSTAFTGQKKFTVQ